MIRLIDANALKRKVQRIATEAWMMKLNASVETTLNQFIDYIDDAPTIDAVSVVRCKECVKRMREDCPMCNGCKLDRVPTEDDDYCSYGEREGE